MKHLLPLTLLCALLGTATPLFAQATTPPKTDKEKLSYAIGMNVAETFKAKGIDLDTTAFGAAVRDVLSGAPPQMTDAEAKTVLMDQFGGGKNKREGLAFLSANKAKTGIQTLPDGLQYKVIKEGSGPMPKASDSVTVKYSGALINGTVFDASEKHGGTATFPVSGVIKGWTEALLKMKTGAKWQLYIPAELAYGDNPPTPEIPPGSVLIFDVELVSIGK